MGQIPIPPEAFFNFQFNGSPTINQEFLEKKAVPALMEIENDILKGFDKDKKRFFPFKATGEVGRNSREIGFGHTFDPKEQDFSAGITMQEAKSLLLNDLNQHAQTARRLVGPAVWDGMDDTRKLLLAEKSFNGALVSNVPGRAFKRFTAAVLKNDFEGMKKEIFPAKGKDTRRAELLKKAFLDPIEQNMVRKAVSPTDPILGFLSNVRRKLSSLFD